MTGLAEIIEGLSRRVTELERRNASSARTGVVTEVNAAKGLARVRLQSGDQAFVTGWLPWEEGAAGSNKTHIPPSEGQQVTLCSESGDLRDATIRGSLNSGAQARPSGAGDEYVLASVGQASITISGGGATMVLAVGASSITLSNGAIVISSPRLDLN